MRLVKNGIFESIVGQGQLLAVLIDPDKFEADVVSSFLKKIPEFTTHLFVGGSTVEKGRTEACIERLKQETSLPIIIFPGDHSQITPLADALLFLSLISGRNPEYLIEQQVQAVDSLQNMDLEVIPTGYILVDGGRECAVQRVSKTLPMSQERPEEIVKTALAGEFSGKKLIYLEAGSGAKKPVSEEIIKAVKNAVSIPLIVGGGIRSSQQLEAAYAAGADMVVVGTAFEKGEFFTATAACSSN
ncbi:putative glycerol-1-phosphate prenyltransferase [Salinimicrobium catena]|uniref:Geranylgeranylglyceryl phosphate synthase n=1 Tax=Salinimicrobium catena TaxID=390640 RepID=A0A1H5JH57_9FLAO|nr:geranylgeranylglyceryl/heptaprenylglyceryl phosphate synthase [Salinimicrobium catena]SDK87616.1 putative glycerol-1-phosphate prenyltransferase [Salinimicrobium catena]SEE51799.1 putative glycerol-1-phosphate prenyltransferase [Salinimicrobium catena]